MELWVDKYKPKNLSDIIGNKLQIKNCEKWLSNFKKDKNNTTNCLLISGSPGIGKTTFAYLLLKKYDYDILEFNASDIRNQKLIKEKFSNIVGKTSISSIMGGCKYSGIIMDEVDGISSGDKGGIGELLSFINPKKNKTICKKKNPIICITNTIQDKKIKEIRKYSEYVSFIYPKANDLYTLAQKINSNENMNLNEDYLLKIINFSENDIRKLINTLELFNKKNQNIDEFLNNLNSKKKITDYIKIYLTF